MKKSLQLFYITLISLTIIDILLLVQIIFYPVDSNFKFWVRTFDLLLCILMWIEFIYSYRHAEDKRQYLRDNSLSILGMLPIDFIFLRALRLIKLLQLIKVFVLARETSGTISGFLKRTYLDKIIFVSIIFIFIVTILVGISDPGIDNVQAAFWYVIVSMTSTGYGDFVPTTPSGRLVGIIIMVGGILIFATVTAVISSIYVSRITKDNRDDLESKIDDLTCKVNELNKKIDLLMEKK